VNFTTLDDVIKFAVEREDMAFRLYTNAARRTDSISSRKVFEELAHEEEGHKKSFENLDLSMAHEYKIVDRPDMRLADYMTHIPFREDFTYAEILHYAMKTEEDAFKLYTEAAAATTDERLKKMLQVLADIEKGHKRRIEDLYELHVLTEN
jgi:rubrerythrin